MLNSANQRQAKHHTDGLLSPVKSLLEIFICALFVVTFIMQPSRIPSGSMLPTLRVGDFLLIDMQSYARRGTLGRLLPATQIKRGDIVVFHYPIDASLDLVKRVIGVPGDRLRLRRGHVLLNGRLLQEPYAFYSPAPPNGFRDEFPSLLEADPNADLRWWIELRKTVAGGDVIVPPGQYFVLGDNRNDSEDSRYWGFVPRSAIIGRPLLVYFTLPLAGDMSSMSPLQRLRHALRGGIHSWRILR
jgi:signal peptidase I